MRYIKYRRQKFTVFSSFFPYLFLSLPFFPKAGCVATTLEVTSHQALKSLFPIFFSFYSKERNHGENVGATALMVGRICSPDFFDPTSF